MHAGCAPLCVHAHLDRRKAVRVASRRQRMMRATAYRMTVAAVALWFGGLSCAAGCLAEVVAIRAAAAIESEGAGCADDCCPLKGEEKPRHEHSPGEQHKETDCCQFLSAPANLAAKKAEERPVPTITAQPVMAETGPAPHPVAGLSFLPDRSDTHLRYRVLRI